MAALCSAFSFAFPSGVERVARASLLLARCVRFLNVPRCRYDDAGVLWWRRLPSGRPNGSPRLPSDSGEGQPGNEARERTGETQQQRKRTRQRQGSFAAHAARRGDWKATLHRQAPWIRILRKLKDIEAVRRRTLREVRTAVSTTSEKRVYQPTVLPALLAPKPRGASRRSRVWRSEKRCNSLALARVPVCESVCRSGASTRCHGHGRRTALPPDGRSFTSRAVFTQSRSRSRPSIPAYSATSATACVTRSHLASRLSRKRIDARRSKAKRRPARHVPRYLLRDPSRLDRAWSRYAP
ncbi:hypothetical protein HPB50_019086 [Hyalomma asiaticum]|uniref:Uncharacterized protein n=1 Tax=Hyalomma asiaticum TaxID=266040 RepID=A0ACB7RK16_HYAAI|nr:hypothetical protein HPB50_019086 [Hyalomma asiaticum]